MTRVSEIDSKTLREVLAAFATGVTVITRIDDQGIARGMTVNSFTSVSLSPPMILWCLAKDSPNDALFKSVRRFAVNILAEEQKHLSDHFATFNAGLDHVEYTSGLDGVPILTACVATLECVTEHLYPGGDHHIIVARVDGIRRDWHSPLVFFNGRYATVGGWVSSS